VASSLCSRKRQGDPGRNNYSTITDLSAVASTQAGHFNASPASAKVTPKVFASRWRGRLASTEVWQRGSYQLSANDYLSAVASAKAAQLFLPSRGEALTIALSLFLTMGLSRSSLALRCVKGHVAAHAGAGAVGSHNSEMISMVCS
jgi:hypothetical protein